MESIISIFSFQHKYEKQEQAADLVSDYLKTKLRITPFTGDNAEVFRRLGFS